MLLHVVTSICEGEDRGPDSRVVGVFTDKDEADKCVRREFEAFEIQGHTKVESWHGGSFDPTRFNPRFRVTIGDGKLQMYDQVRISVFVEVVHNIAFTLGQRDSNEHPNTQKGK